MSTHTQSQFVSIDELPPEPPRTNSVSSRMAEYDALMTACIEHPGQALKITPGDGENSRSIRLRTGQAITRAHRDGRVTSGTIVTTTRTDGNVYAVYSPEAKAPSVSPARASRKPAVAAESSEDGAAESPARSGRRGAGATV